MSLESRSSISCLASVYWRTVKKSCMKRLILRPFSWKKPPIKYINLKRNYLIRNKTSPPVRKIASRWKDSWKRQTKRSMSYLSNWSLKNRRLRSSEYLSRTRKKKRLNLDTSSMVWWNKKKISLRSNSRRASNCSNTKLKLKSWSMKMSGWVMNWKSTKKARKSSSRIWRRLIKIWRMKKLRRMNRKAKIWNWEKN